MKTNQLMLLTDFQNGSDQQSTPSLAGFVRRPAAAGVMVVMVFVAGSIGWATFAPIAAGAVAQGVISPDGSRRTVQHLEGGIIRRILARDGDDVVAGQTLVELQTTQAAATYDMLTEQAQTFAATRARLMAEQAGSPEIEFPADLLRNATSDIRAILDGQRALFQQRRRSYLTQVEIIETRVRQYGEQISAFDAQVKSAAKQIDLIDEELVGKNAMFKQGLTTKSEVLRLERAKASLLGDHGRAVGSILEVQQKIDELAAQKLSLEADRSTDIGTDLEKVRSQYAEVAEKLNASRDVLERTRIVAPVAGKIVNSRFKTDSGVIKPGDPILDIVPSGEQLLIDVQISPVDIDVVRPDLLAIVHLSAYSSRGLPRINGMVKSVSADRIVDQATGSSYFLARVEVSKADLAQLDQSIVLMPGMPAEVTVVTEERTVLAYLLEPFWAAFRRGMREV